MHCLQLVMSSGCELLLVVDDEVGGTGCLLLFVVEVLRALSSIAPVVVGSMHVLSISHMWSLYSLFVKVRVQNLQKTSSFEMLLWMLFSRRALES